MKTRPIASLLLLLGVLFVGASQAEVLDLVPVQGVLTDSEGTPVDGLVDVTFTLYSSETGDTSLWTETYTDLDVVDGFFSVYLGTNTFLDFYSLTSNPEIWLGITVETDAEMNRIMLASVPFAVEAMTSNQVGSLTEDDINNNFVASSAPAASVTSDQMSQWDAAYAWGNHADAGYLTSASLSESDPVFSAWDKDYDDLINTPTIPTKVSDLTNDAAYLSSETDPIFAAWDKDYSDLINSPTNVSDLPNDAGYLTAEVDGSITNEIELPSQNGNSGKVLSTNGTSPSWVDDDVLTESEVDSYVSDNGYLTSAAATNLSNISNVAVNTDLIVYVDDSYDLGGNGAEWKDLYIDGTAYVDAVSVNNAYSLPTTDGSNGQVLSTDGSGNLSWDDDAGATQLNELSDASISSPSQGDIMYFNGTNWVNLGVGTSGQVLQTNGAGANPSWENSSGGSGSLTITEISSDTTLSTEDQLVIITDAITVTLPASPGTGQRIKLVTDDNTASINQNGKSVNIQGVDYSGTYTFSDWGGYSVEIVYNGTKWFRLYAD